MTIFAGILSRSNRAVPVDLRRALTSSLSRHPTDVPVVIEDDGFCCAIVDFGIFGGPGHLFRNDGLTLLAGEPLLGDRDTPHPREDDLEALHDGLLRDDPAPLRQANGVFALAQVQPARLRVRLVADKLAIRPIYYAITPGWIVFSTVHRLFDTLPGFERTMDMRAVTEVSAFWCALGDRTQYVGVRRIRAGEIAAIDPEGLTRSVYWRWDGVEVSGEPVGLLAERAYRLFVRGIARRHDDVRGPLAYLSGGLDSRAVVSALVSQGRVPHTYNFAVKGTLDRALGAAVAARLETIHHERQKSQATGHPDYEGLMASALAETMPPPPAHGGHLVWAGEGGSVALGHVHMHASVVERMRAGDLEGAIDEFCVREDVRLPLKLFKPAVARRIGAFVREGLVEELARVEAAEPGRRFHLFLLHNDQGRKLTRHFESLDVHRVELQLPFFDSAFLSTVVSVPVDACLGHHFYSAWFAHFDARVREVPWQAYPEHDPCPLPMPEGLADQWQADFRRAAHAASHKAVVRRAREMVLSSDFPHTVLSRPRVIGVAALHMMGLRNYEYALDVASWCYAYARACGGKWTMGEAAGNAAG